MPRLLAEMARELGALPFPYKVAIGAALVLNFIIITQWERLFPGAAPKPVPVAATPAPAPSRFEFEQPAAAKDVTAAQVQAILAKRMAPVTMYDPRIERDGRILNDGQSLFLYGVKRFDARNVCTRANGDRWACGLQAYATLRNEVVNKSVTCEPRRLADDGVYAACRLGDVDLAEFLVSRGLIEVEDASATTLTRAQNVARAQRIGIWDRP